MNNKLRPFIAPVIILFVFLFTFYYGPRVKEDHFNILILASAFSPLALLLLAKSSLKVGVIQSIALQLFYVLYGMWYWNYRDALTDHYFSFENSLKLDLLAVVFAVSLVVALTIRFITVKIRDISLRK